MVQEIVHLGHLHGLEGGKGLLGGGGHAAAAGASVPGGVEGAKAAILQALRDSGVKL